MTTLTDWDAYAKAMISGDVDTCVEIEQKYDLFGYPPEIVSVGLNALANGLDQHDAINTYVGENDS